MASIETANLWFKKYSTALPAYLGYFNIAAMKWRNMHLGHFIGDEDIDCLIRNANKFGSDSSIAVRIGGDEVINFFNSETSIFELNTAYSKNEDIILRYKITAILNGKKLEKNESRKTKIYRCLRSVYIELKQGDIFENVIKDMMDVISLCTPGEPKRFNDVKGFLPLPEPIVFEKLSDLSMEDQNRVIDSVKNRWHCIEQPLNYSYICLFCNGTLFDWLGGDSGPSAEGICKNCGAVCSFEG